MEALSICSILSVILPFEKNKYFEKITITLGLCFLMIIYFETSNKISEADFWNTY